MRIYLLLLIFSISVSCKKSEQPLNADNNNMSKKDGIKNVDNVDLTTRLYQDYIQNVTNQDHIDQNLLIEYAVNNNMDVTRSTSGLYYIIHEPGSGPLLKPSENLSVDYKGAFLDGQVFDSSYERGEPIEFHIGQMIPGWNEGLRYLRHGSKATFLIPSKLAYKAKGFPGFVPPNKALVFDIEVH